MAQKCRIYPIVSSLRQRAGAVLLVGDPQASELPLMAPAKHVGEDLQVRTGSSVPLLAAGVARGGLCGARDAGAWESAISERLQLPLGSYTLILGVEEWSPDRVRYQWGLVVGLHDFEGVRLKLQTGAESSTRVLRNPTARQGIRL